MISWFKSKKRLDHLQDLCQIFERLQKCQLNMNPLKCAFSVMFGNFLGFIVPHNGIEVKQAKIKAILGIPPAKNHEERRCL